MIFHDIITEALTPDPLEQAKSKVQTQRIAAVIRERREKVHSALRAARSVPSRGVEA